MVKKRILSVMMAVLLVAVLAAGCGKNDSAEETEIRRQQIQQQNRNRKRKIHIRYLHCCTAADLNLWWRWIRGSRINAKSMGLR